MVINCKPFYWDINMKIIKEAFKLNIERSIFKKYIENHGYMQFIHKYMSTTTQVVIVHYRTRKKWPWEAESVPSFSIGDLKVLGWFMHCLRLYHLRKLTQNKTVSVFVLLHPSLSPPSSSSFFSTTTTIPIIKYCPPVSRIIGIIIISHCIYV